ncbi:nucleotide-binding universal stress UspA family protein [Saonia flava]|uniref:Nucleotide-binding universal stress UspA family protein n=1 Tax=Saonia flava TaxID=523696 RepID=A0A846QW10_9FLAO|nr:universal stress protein [Saonia flava]NJB72178.1 nucleotide-binding universal stress UspA family protein [Saonia flava]
MYRILIPVDFSDYSEYALEIACSIAREMNGQIVLLHMMGLSESVYDKNEAQEYKEAMYYMGLSKKRFKSFLDKPYTKGIKITEIVQNYKVFSELDNVSREQNIDLIIMGSQGAKGLDEVFVGSNAEKVVRTSEVPVLVVKSPNPNFKIKRIVFASDFKVEGLEALKKTINFSKLFSAELLLLYVNTPGNKFLRTLEIEEKISEFQDKLGTNLKVIVYDDYNVELGILNYCTHNKVDLIALPTHGRKGLPHFLMGSIGEDLANHSTLPVLTIKM